VGTGGHVLRAGVGDAGVRIYILRLLHVPDGDDVPQPGPVGVHLRIAVIIITVHSGHIPP
ncbi:DUF1292 domain-containing protein, partial [Dysosmobacter welbionis]